MYLAGVGHLLPHGAYQAAHDSFCARSTIAPAPQVDEKDEIDGRQYAQHARIDEVHIPVILRVNQS